MAVSTKHLDEKRARRERLLEVKTIDPKPEITKPQRVIIQGNKNPASKKNIKPDTDS